MMYRQSQFSLLAQAGIFLAFVGAGLVLSSLAITFIAVGLYDIPMAELSQILTDPKYRGFARTAQAVSSLVMLGLPSILFAFVVGHRRPMEYLGFHSYLSGKQVFFLVLMVVPALMLSGGLAELNKIIPLSAEWAARFKAMEEAYTQQVMQLASMQSVQELLVSLLVLALAPAVFEEMLFRGTLQNFLMRSTRRAVLSIVIASLVFSAIHLSFYGFLSRFFLGILLGYVYYFTGNLWSTVILHFFNNALIIGQMYVLNRQGRLTREAMEETVPVLYALLAVPILVMLLVALKRESRQVTAYRILDEAEQQHRAEQEKKDNDPSGPAGG